MRGHPFGNAAQAMDNEEPLPTACTCLPAATAPQGNKALFYFFNLYGATSPPERGCYLIAPYLTLFSVEKVTVLLANLRP